MLLESVINNLTGASWMSAQSTATSETRSMLEHEIDSVNLPVSVVIGQTRLSIRDLLQLQRGDILALDKSYDSDLLIQVGDRTKMAGKSGLIGRKKAARITRVIEKEVPGSHE
jgi:flagellar motor switch protein FliM